MKRILVMIVIAAFVLSACDSGKSVEAPNETEVAVQKNLAQMQNQYFPMDIGKEWNYEVSINQIAYTYYEQIWPMGKQSIGYSVNGFLYPDKIPAYLTLKIDSSAPVQGPFKYPNGVKLDIVRDDAKIFPNTKEMFYNMTSDNAFKSQVQLVETYDPFLSSAPQNAISDGYSYRIIFFTVDPQTVQYAALHVNEDKPIIQLNLEGSPDSLYFLGFDNNLEGYDKQISMHFQRVVDNRDNDPKFTPIKEDLWFIQNIGLVRMIQTSGDIETMTWELVPDISN